MLVVWASDGETAASARFDVDGETAENASARFDAKNMPIEAKERENFMITDIGKLWNEVFRKELFE